MTTIPPLPLLELRLRALKPIRKLPHFHGPHWSALLRDLVRNDLPGNDSLAKAEIWLQTVEMGINTYEPEENLNLGLSFPISLAPIIGQCLERFNDGGNYQGHFQPGNTVLLEEVFCRVSREPWSAAKPCPLTEEILESEIAQLRRLDDFTLHLHAPLRCTRPAGRKAESHRYVDEAYLFSPPEPDNPWPLDALFQRMRTPGAEAISAQGLRIIGGAGTWLDIPYGNPKGKTLGGLVGQIRIAGRPTPEQARFLVKGQYIGSGKNAPFGLGFYTIPELGDFRQVAPLRRGASLLQRIAVPDTLARSLARLPNSSPGPDGLCAADLRAAGEPFLSALAQDLVQGRFRPGPQKRYRLPKASGGNRDIIVQNSGERLVHRALADHLGPVVDNLLSQSAYAYRRGLSRKSAAARLQELLAKGFTCGIKTDIEAFFDSVRHDILVPVLRGLFPAEPAVDLIAQWLDHAGDAGSVGLPQGGSLSPLLSNLYLDRFDRDMERENMRLVRFADDFVVLFNKKQGEEQGLRTVRESLARLGLLLKNDKTIPLAPGQSIKFLGYLVSAEGVVDAQKEEFGEDEQWAPVFRDTWQGGQPVYLTTLCRGARSNGANLVIQREEGKSESIPWNSISRIIVVGRSPFSGGVVYRAVREDIPLTFIDILGRTRGQLHAAGYPQPDLADLQGRCAANPQFCLTFAREIISAKIHNSMVVLRRNHKACSELAQLSARAREAADLDQLRGFEGSAARIYFAGFADLVAPFEFRGRVYRPPDGPVNVMLSFGYTLLYHRIAAVLRDTGFNARQGFFHQGRGSHCALASDLQEELRHLVDRVVLALIHLKEIKPEDFGPQNREEQIVWRLGGDAFRAFVRRFEATMARKFNLGEKGQISYNAYLDEMAEKLRRSLRLGLPYQAMRIR